MLPPLARVWAYPLWCSVKRSGSADAVAEDVDWWVRCYDDEDLLKLDQYSRFTYLAIAFDGVPHPHPLPPRSAPWRRRLLQAL